MISYLGKKTVIKHGKNQHKMAFRTNFSTNFPRADFLGNALGNVLSDKLSNNVQRTWKQRKNVHAKKMRSDIVITKTTYPIRTKITSYMSFNASYVM
jgi:hypothetical protein